MVNHLNNDPRQNEGNDEVVQAHQPCDDCGSTDALAIYADGHTFCFACSKFTGAGDDKRLPQNTGDLKTPKKKEAKPLDTRLREGTIQELKHRGLSLVTCKALGYQVAGRYNIEMALYYNAKNEPAAQKLRSPSKEFRWVGNNTKLQLYGQQLWQGSKRNTLIITEGEIDMMSIYQTTRGTLPVVSLINGASGAVRDIKQNYEFVDSFETVVLCYDMDTPGREAVTKTAELFAVGKIKVCELPLKDANEMLLKGRTRELLEALEHAKPHDAGGLMYGQELIDEVLADDPESDELYPWHGLNKKTNGIHYGSLVTVTAGIGMGKTTLLTELMYALNRGGHKVGMLMLEETAKTTARRLVGHHINKPLQVSREGVDPQEVKSAAQEVLGQNGIILYDNRGSLDMEAIFQKIRFMVKVEGVRFVVLDNLSAIVAGLNENDERRAIDRAMRQIWQLAQSEQIVIFLAVHLKRIEGSKGHEDGAKLSLSHLRGSQSIASNSDLVIGLERDQQGEESDISTIRILKNRLTGETGVAGELYYNKETGRMSELDAPQGALEVGKTQPEQPLLFEAVESEEIHDPEDCPFDLENTTDF